MMQQFIFTGHRLRDDFTTNMQCFIAGVVLGIGAWKWGTSPLPALGLKLASGFGFLMLLLLLVVALLAIAALTVKGRVGLLARGDFFNLLPSLLAQLLRAACVFLGVVVVAMMCYGVTDSGYALKTALLGCMFSVTCAWLRTCLVAIAHQLGQPRMR